MRKGMARRRVRQALGASSRMLRSARVLALTALGVAACTSPDPSIYTLVPLPGSAGVSVFRNIEIRRPGLASYLDRSDIVLRVSDYQLSTNSQQRWAAPLGDTIGRVLASDLSQRLPGSSVYTDEGAISADPDARVEVDVRRFEPDTGGTLVLDVAYAIEQGRGHRPLSAQNLRLTTQLSPGARAQAAGMSTLVAELADRIAADLRGAVLDHSGT